MITFALVICGDGPATVEAGLLQQSPEKQLDALVVQLISTSEVAWQKHILLQRSMLLLLVGVGLLTISVMWPR